MTSTTPNSEFSLTSGEICSIIKAGGKSGLLKLEYKGLSLNFGSSVAPLTVDPQQKHQLSAEELDNLAQMKLPGLALENETDKQTYMDQMVVDDPVEWERRMNEADDAKARFRGTE